jgi:hypothetical protein
VVSFPPSAWSRLKWWGPRALPGAQVMRAAVARWVMVKAVKRAVIKVAKRVVI